MIEGVNAHFRPIFREGAALTTCTEKLWDLVRKIQEYFMKILQAILPCLFGNPAPVVAQEVPIPAVAQPEPRIAAVQEQVLPAPVPRAPVRALPALPQVQPVEAPPFFPNFSHLVYNDAQQEQVVIDNPAEILGNPHFLRFPEDPDFVAYGIGRAFDTIRPVKRELYKQQFIHPEQPGEIDPYLWTAACSIVHYICCWAYANPAGREVLGCPHFLAPYLQQSVNGAKSLEDLSTRFNRLSLFHGLREAMRGYEDQAKVMMKIRDPFTSGIMSPDARLLVADILNLAHVVSNTPHFRNELYPQAVALLNERVD